MRKALALFLCLVLPLCLLCGCGEDEPKEALKYNTAYPLGAAEYQMAVNHKLAPLISELQALASAETVSKESAEEVITSINSILSAITEMNPPKDKAVYQADLMEDLQAASDWLKVQHDSEVKCPDRDFAEILRDIENAFNVSVN